jgi:hypothetical protein
MKLIPTFDHDELASMQLGVIVEMYPKCVGRWTSGRHRRAYLKEFNEKERGVIARYYKIAYGWYMRRGIPLQYRMELKTYELLKRATNFFGTI